MLYQNNDYFRKRIFKSCSYVGQTPIYKNGLKEVLLEDHYK